MSSTFAIANTGLRTAQQRLDGSARNIANISASAARDPQAVPATSAAGGTATILQTAVPATSLTQDLVGAKQATYAFQANVKLIKTADSMLGTLLDIKA